MFEVQKTENGYEAEELWKSLHLKSKFNNFVFRDGYLYGLDDGMLTCIEVATGRRTWKKAVMVMGNCCWETIGCC